MQACCPCWRSWSSWTSRWCASAIMVEIDETEDENDGWWSPKTRPTTLSQQGSTVLSRSRNIIYYVITVVENNKDNENHGSRRIKHLFLVSRKIILQNHASRLLWKSRFTRKKFAISHFTEKKEPITSHENTLYHPRNTLMKVIEKLSKYKDLEIETTRMWGMRTETVPFIVGTLWLIRGGMDQNLGKIPGASNINELQKIILRRTAHVTAHNWGFCPSNKKLPWCLRTKHWSRF